jgi:hypothetical protein
VLPGVGPCSMRLQLQQEGGAGRAQPGQQQQRVAWAVACVPCGVRSRVCVCSQAGWCLGALWCFGRSWIFRYPGRSAGPAALLDAARVRAICESSISDPAYMVRSLLGAQHPAPHIRKTPPAFLWAICCLHGREGQCFAVVVRAAR